MGWLIVFGIAYGPAHGQDLPRRAVIGLQVGPGNQGVIVQRVIEGGAGAAAGFRPGDVIRTLDAAAVQETAQFTQAIARHLGGDSVQVGLVRDGREMTLRAALQPRPLETSPYAEVIYASVDVRGTRRRVIVTKPGREGKMPAVLLMQGLGCYSMDSADRRTGYGRIIGELEQKGFVTMRVEKTGEGDSEGPPCTGLQATTDLEADGYVAGIQRLKSYEFVDPKKVFVFAHSMGPVVGSLAVSREPVAGFIAVETVGKSWFEYDLERSRVQAELAGSTPEEVDQHLRQYEKCSYGFYVEKDEPEQVEQMPGCHGFMAPFGGAPYTYMQGVADISLGKEWKSADFPVLVLYGTSSPVTTAEEGKYLAHMINRMHPGRATYAEVPGMGHDFNRYASQAEYMRDAGKPGHEFDDALFQAMMPWLEKLAV